MSRPIDRTCVHVSSSRKSLRTRLSCESLEGRALLSGMGTSAGLAGWHSFAAGGGHLSSSRTPADFQSWAGRGGSTHLAMNQGGAAGFPFKGDPGGGQGLGGIDSLSELVGIGLGGPGLGGSDFGKDRPDGPGGPGGPDSSMAMMKDQAAGMNTPPTMPAAVTTAQATLQTDLNAALPTGFQTPSKDALDALQTDLKAQRAGTLTGTAATDKIQADKDAILASTGLTSSQVAAVDAASKQLETDMKAARPTGNTPPPTTPSATITADKDAVLAAAGLSSSQISAIDAANARMMKDNQAIHAGTLTGDAATAALKADHDSLLSAIGVSQAHIDTIDADTTALQAAMKAASGSMTPPTTTGMTTPGGFHARRFGRA